MPAARRGRSVARRGNLNASPAKPTDDKKESGPIEDKEKEKAGSTQQAVTVQIDFSMEGSTAKSGEKLPVETEKKLQVEPEEQLQVESATANVKDEGDLEGDQGDDDDDDVQTGDMFVVDELVEESSESITICSTTGGTGIGLTAESSILLEDDVNPESAECSQEIDSLIAETSNEIINKNNQDIVPAPTASSSPEVLKQVPQTDSGAVTIGEKETHADKEIIVIDDEQQTVDCSKTTEKDSTETGIKAEITVETEKQTVENTGDSDEKKLDGNDSKDVPGSEETTNTQSDDDVVIVKEENAGNTDKQGTSDADKSQSTTNTDKPESTEGKASDKGDKPAGTDVAEKKAETPGDKVKKPVVIEKEYNPYPASLAKLRQLTVNIGPIRLDDLKSESLHDILRISNNFEIKFEPRDKNKTDPENISDYNRVGSVRLPFNIRTPFFLVRVATKLGGLKINGRDLSIRFPETFNNAVEECKNFINVQKKRKPDGALLRTRQILVKQLPKNVTDETLKELFPGAVKISMRYDSRMGAEEDILGSAVVEFATEQDCVKVNNDRLKYKVDGKPVKMNRRAKDTGKRRAGRLNDRPSNFPGKLSPRGGMAAGRGFPAGRGRMVGSSPGRASAGQGAGNVSGGQGLGRGVSAGQGRANQVVRKAVAGIRGRGGFGNRGSGFSDVRGRAGAGNNAGSNQGGGGIGQGKKPQLGKRGPGVTDKTGTDTKRRRLDGSQGIRGGQFGMNSGKPSTAGQFKDSGFKSMGPPKSSPAGGGGNQQRHNMANNSPNQANRGKNAQGRGRQRSGPASPVMRGQGGQFGQIRSPTYQQGGQNRSPQGRGQRSSTSPASRSQGDAYRQTRMSPFRQEAQRSPQFRKEDRRQSQGEDPMAIVEYLKSRLDSMEQKLSQQQTQPHNQQSGNQGNRNQPRKQGRNRNRNNSISSQGSQTGFSGNQNRAGNQAKSGGSGGGFNRNDKAADTQQWKRSTGDYGYEHSPKRQHYDGSHSQGDDYYSDKGSRFSSSHDNSQGQSGFESRQTRGGNDYYDKDGGSYSGRQTQTGYGTNQSSTTHTDNTKYSTTAQSPMTVGSVGAVPAQGGYFMGYTMPQSQYMAQTGMPQSGMSQTGYQGYNQGWSW